MDKYKIGIIVLLLLIIAASSTELYNINRTIRQSIKNDEAITQKLNLAQQFNISVLGLAFAILVYYITTIQNNNQHVLMKIVSFIFLLWVLVISSYNIYDVTHNVIISTSTYSKQWSLTVNGLNLSFAIILLVYYIYYLVHKHTTDQQRTKLFHTFKSLFNSNKSAEGSSVVMNTSQRQNKQQGQKEIELRQIPNTSSQRHTSTRQQGQTQVSQQH